MDISFSVEQLYLLGLASSVFLMIARLVVEQVFRVNLSGVPRQAWMVILYALAFALGVVWFPSSLPAFPAISGEPTADALSIVQFLGALLSALTYHVFVAAKIYDEILKRLKDSLFGA